MGLVCSEHNLIQKYRHNSDSKVISRQSGKVISFLLKEYMVIKDIDINIEQLLKADTQFYAIRVSSIGKGTLGNGDHRTGTGRSHERYIREVFIPEYAKNFNKELSASDIKFYGKIHFNRSRSDNELNMHCHLIVSRKD